MKLLEKEKAMIHRIVSIMMVVPLLAGVAVAQSNVGVGGNVNVPGSPSSPQVHVQVGTPMPPPPVYVVQPPRMTKEKKNRGIQKGQFKKHHKKGHDGKHRGKE